MSQPKPAQVADYDSDESRIVSGTEVSAKTSSKRRTQEQSSSSRAPKQGERTSRSAAPVKAASDSGYSSTPAAGMKAAPASAVATTPAKVAHSTSQPATTPSPAKKPIIHRQDSARGTTRAATISNTTAKREKTEKCIDPHCRDPNCESSRNTERRYTISDSKRTSMPPPPPPVQAQYQYQPQYDYAAMPPPSAIPPARRESMSRPRPHSIHVPTGMPMTYSTAHPGATPGYSYGYAPVPGSYAPPQAVYGATPPSQPIAYSQPSPVKAAVPSSPSTGTYPNYPGQTGKISARTGNPAVPGLNTSIPMQTAPPAYNVSAGGMSARVERRRSVQYPERRRTHDEEFTSSESESSHDERDDARYDYHRDEQDRRRAPKAIDYERHRSKSRRRRSVVIEDPRPPARKSYTTSALPTRQNSRRESSSRPESFYRTTSDPLGDYDSGDTSRAVLERRERDRRDASKRQSRRLSVSTAGDSYDTPPTSISNGSGYVAVIEDKRGSRRVYLSKEQYDDLQRKYEREDRDRDRYEEQRMQQERIERYQQEQRAGLERQNLTATNIKQAGRPSKSHVSRSSQKSTSSSKLTRGGLTLESNGTMLYLEEGIPAIALKRDENGGTRVIIGSGDGREQSYHGSKSSGSRVARSRTARERPIREEDQYEKAL